MSAFLCFLSASCPSPPSHQKALFSGSAPFICLIFTFSMSCVPVYSFLCRAQETLSKRLRGSWQDAPWFLDVAHFSLPLALFVSLSFSPLHPCVGETLLHRACKKNQVETLLCILRLPGTDVNIKGRFLHSSPSLCRILPLFRCYFVCVLNS